MSSLSREDFTVFLVCGYIKAHIEKKYKGLLVPQAINLEIIVFVGYFGLDSVILTDEENGTLQSLLSEQWNRNRACIEFNLLYRASRDGKDAMEFYNRCGVENTLCVIRAENPKQKINVFGGFTTRAWDLKKPEQTDENAFLFLLRSSEKYPPQIFNLLPKKKGVITSKRRYMCFIGAVGDGPLLIEENDEEDTCICTSEPENPFDVPKDKCRNYLNGSDGYNFRALEIEVFQVM